MSLPDHDDGVTDDEAEESSSFVTQGTLAARYLDCLLASDRLSAIRLVDEAVADGVSVHDLYLTVIQSTQYEIGRLWELDRISVADEHFCTGVSQLVIARLYPTWLKVPAPNAPRALVVCVDSELHELGARMVADFLEMEGWDTQYIGASSPQGTVAALTSGRPVALLAISTTMSAHLFGTRRIIEAVHALPASKQPRIVVGGYAFRSDEEEWRQIGADGYGRDADEAVRVAHALTSPRDAIS